MGREEGKEKEKEGRRGKEGKERKKKRKHIVCKQALVCQISKKYVKD